MPNYNPFHIVIVLVYFYIYPLNKNEDLEEIQDVGLHHARELHWRCRGKWEALQRDDKSKLFKSLSLGLTLGLVGKTIIIIYYYLCMVVLFYSLCYVILK